MLDNIPFFSIICPLYNSSNYIDFAINSVLKQTFTNWELILIDDCSEDTSYEVISNYEKKYSNIFVLHNEKNVGQAISRNRGLDIAKGKYITFLDSDDYIKEDYLQKAFKIISEFSPDLLSTNFEYFNKKIIPIHLIDEFAIVNGEQAYNNFLRIKSFHSAPWAKFYKSDLLTTLRFPNFKAREDVFFLHSFLPKCLNVVLSDIYGYVAVLHSDSIERVGFNINKLNSIESAKLAIHNCETLFPNLLNVAKSYAGHIYARLIVDIAKTKSFKLYTNIFDLLLVNIEKYILFMENKKEKRLVVIAKKNRRLFTILCKIGMVK